MRHDFAIRFFCIRNAALPGLFVALTALALPAAAADAPALYQQHCAVCHGPGRLGVTGPALLPESLSRLPAEKQRALAAAVGEELAPHAVAGGYRLTSTILVAGAEPV